MLSDLRFALRQLRKSPGFAATAILTLALGIGASTAIFSVVNSLLLEPLPYPDSHRIMQLFQVPEQGGRVNMFAGGGFLDLEEHTTQLDFISAIHLSDRNLSGQGDPVMLRAGDVTPNYLRALGVKPALGRDFISSDDTAGGNRQVTIITHELWQSRFGGDPGVVDRAIRLEGESFTVIGVLPPHALMDGSISLLLPSSILAVDWKHSREWWYHSDVIARLKPGANAIQASAELSAMKLSLKSSYPVFMQGWTITMIPLHEALFGNSRNYVFTLLGAVGVVLLIACVNVANLLLARAAARHHEIAVRVALGAKTVHIVRQLLTESMVLSIAGGLAGIVFAHAAIQPLLTFTGLQTLPGIPVGIDGRVLFFALTIAAFTGLVFGTFPALSASRPNLRDGLNDSARGSMGRSRRRVQSSLIVIETALTVVLLVAAGLLLRSFVTALRSEPGFNTMDVLVFSFTQSDKVAPTPEHRVRFVDSVLERIAQIPGVVSAGMISAAPMNGSSYFGDFVSREDKPETHNNYGGGFDGISGDFFQAMGIPLLRGRFFTRAENQKSAPRVMIVSEVLAKQLFGEEDPLGRQLHFKNDVWEIVGVVGNVRRFQLDVLPQPHVYFPQIHFPVYVTIAVRTAVRPLTLSDDVRRAVQSVDPDQAITGLGTLEEAKNRSLRGRIVMVTLLGLFACAALILACVGIYGVIAHMVTQRTREMGIRLALGSTTGRVLRLVLRDGLRLVIIGLVLGAFASFGAGTVIANQLYGVTQQDPLVFTLVSVILLSAATLACWLPARRATKVDPMIALRAE